MKRILVLVSIFFVSCSDKISSEDLHFLNGYWEIEKVEFLDGKKKEYPMNTVIDYFEIKNLQGFRKKMVPRFDGTFETSDDAEPFIIKLEKGSFYVFYKNPLSEWQERLLSLSENSFSVENLEGTTYYFKRFEPLKID